MIEMIFLRIFRKLYLNCFAERPCNLRLRLRLHKARIHVHATTPAIPQIARRSYRSRTRVRCRTSVLSISPKESDALEGNESAACNENLFNGRTRLEFRLVYGETFKCARDYPRTDNRLYRFIAGVLCSKQWNESRPFRNKVSFTNVSRTVPLKLLLAKRDARNRRSFDTDFFDAECRNKGETCVRQVPVTRSLCNSDVKILIKNFNDLSSVLAIFLFNVYHVCIVNHKIFS